LVLNEKSHLFTEMQIKIKKAFGRGERRVLR
jgi:hypothetical protein